MWLLWEKDWNKNHSTQTRSPHSPEVPNSFKPILYSKSDVGWSAKVYKEVFSVSRVEFNESSYLDLRDIYDQDTSKSWMLIPRCWGTHQSCLAWPTSHHELWILWSKQHYNSSSQLHSTYYHYCVPVLLSTIWETSQTGDTLSGEDTSQPEEREFIHNSRQSVSPTTDWLPNPDTEVGLVWERGGGPHWAPPLQLDTQVQLTACTYETTTVL